MGWVPRLRGVAAVALLAPMIAGVAACGQTAGQSEASCVGPFIRSDAQRTPPDRPTTFGTVHPGQRVDVHGWWYYDDVLGCEAGSNASPSADAVRLSLVTADHRSTALATVHPQGRDASFAVTLTVPTDAYPGSGRVTDGQGNTIRIQIAD